MFKMIALTVALVLPTTFAAAAGFSSNEVKKEYTIRAHEALQIINKNISELEEELAAKQGHIMACTEEKEELIRNATERMYASNWEALREFEDPELNSIFLVLVLDYEDALRSDSNKCWKIPVDEIILKARLESYQYYQGKIRNFIPHSGK